MPQYYPIELYYIFSNTEKNHNRSNVVFFYVLLALVFLSFSIAGRADFGIPCDRWDPCFFPDPPPLAAYPAVFATEVVEHFLHPARDWQDMLVRVAPGGLLVVMSSFWTDEAAFPSWSYANDSTHVAFHHSDTLDWIARRWSLDRLPSPDPRVALFRTPPGVPPETVGSIQEKE